MVESRARDEDAFERAAAELRPEWASSVESPSAAPGASTADAERAAKAVAAEPTVIVQPDIAVVSAPAGAPAANLDPAYGLAASPPVGLASGFGVPSAFAPAAPASGHVITPSTSTRHEATVLTRALPTSYRALDSAAPLDVDELSLHAEKRKRQLRLYALAAAACIVLGGLVAWLSGGSDKPTVSAPVAAPAPVVVAPVVQPLPAVVPAVVSGKQQSPSSRVPEPAAGVTSSAPGKVVSQPAQARPALVAKKKVVAPPVRAAKPLAAKPAPSKVAPAKPVKAAPVKAAPKLGKAPAKPAGKNKPQPAPVKRERSPVDVLNPWAN